MRQPSHWDSLGLGRSIAWRLCAGLKSKDELLPAVCAYALARIEPNNGPAHEQAIELLTASLHNKNPHVQSAAVRGLIDLQLAPEQLAPQLTTCIADCDSGMIDEMMDVLAASGEAGLPGLIAALKRPPARARAAALLEHLGPKAAPAVPELVAALSDKDSEVRREVLYALGAIIADKGPADPAIVAALDDPEPAVRATAAYALGRAGPVAKAAVPKLRTALEADDLLVRVTSAWALAQREPRQRAGGRGGHARVDARPGSIARDDAPRIGRSAGPIRQGRRPGHSSAQGRHAR